MPRRRGPQVVECALTSRDLLQLEEDSESGARRWQGRSACPERRLHIL
jgi:hypothetical protein